MVKIPEYGDPTLEAMKKAVEQADVRQNRDYIGASMIGEPCARRVWYKYNKYPEIPVSFIGLAAAECGHYAENLTAQRLRMVPGIELHTHDADGHQYGWIAAEGRLRGHYDGLIRGLLQAPKKIHVWEHKDKDHKKFADFQNKKAKFGEKKTLKEWDEVYYGQAQVNMHFAQTDRHYLTVSYAGGRHYDSCRTEYDGAYAEQLIDRAYKILDASVPPPRINEAPDFFLCKFCPFREVCR